MGHQKPCDPVAKSFRQIALDDQDLAAPCQLRFGARELIGVSRQKRHFPAFARDLDRLSIKRKRLRHARETENRHRDL